MLNKNNQLYSSIFSGGGLLLVLFILVLINVIVYQVNLRWDLTEDDLYSLSDNSKKILSNIDDEIILKMFYSKSIPNVPAYIKNYSSRVIDFLSEYKYQSNGKIKIEIYDPKMDSDEEEWAELYGIEGIHLPTGEKLYFGLVANAADKEEKIAFFDPLREEHLEYDLTELIYKIQTPEKRKIGIISGLPVFGNASGYGMPQQKMPQWFFVEMLKKTYEVKNIDHNADSIGKDLDLLLIINPKDLKQTMAYAIDQFLLSGGRLFIFADPLPLTDPSQRPAQSTGLEPLFKKWGIDFDFKKALIDFDYSTKRPAENNQTEDNPFWLSVPQTAFNSRHVITSQLESMLLLVSGHVEKTDQCAYDFEPLLQSSTNASLVDSFKGRDGYVEKIRNEFKPDNKQYTIAAKITGVFNTAFPEGKPSKESDAKPSKKADTPQADTPHIEKGIKKSTIVIVSDADLLYDGIYVEKLNFLGQTITQVFNDNLNFLLNAAEFLTGSQDLINIRSRGKFKRPFYRVEALEKKAEKKWLSKEQELVKQAEETNRTLSRLEEKKDTSQHVIVSKEQEEQIRQFQEKKKAINKELKKVRRNLNAEIERLGFIIKAINIALMPLLVALAGIGFAIFKHRRITHSLKKQGAR